MSRRIREGESDGTWTISGNGGVMDMDSAVSAPQGATSPERSLPGLPRSKARGPELYQKIHTIEEAQEVIKNIDFSLFPMKFDISVKRCECSPICIRPAVSVRTKITNNKTNIEDTLEDSGGFDFPCSVECLVTKVVAALKHALTHEVDECFKYNSKQLVDPHGPFSFFRR